MTYSINTIDCRDCGAQFDPSDCLTIYCDACVDRRMNPLEGMTQAKWVSLTTAQRDAIRSKDGLSPQLVGLEGWRVEVVTEYGETRRFIVGRSTGWIPCHLEVSRRNSFGGVGAEKKYKSVSRLYRAR